MTFQNVDPLHPAAVSVVRHGEVMLTGRAAMTEVMGGHLSPLLLFFILSRHIKNSLFFLGFFSSGR
ncbi:hypothetical protein [Nonomuraea salmonea]|uniref:hypothetical protein n=1 Tax=Nonomuraea salmonea TaxID=46181 RepID=UPI0031E7BF2C